jgi:hypothetical protein
MLEERELVTLEYDRRESARANRSTEVHCQPGTDLDHDALMKSWDEQKSFPFGSQILLIKE